MLEKIKSILPIVALVVMILGVSYISASDNKKTASQEKYESANSQQINDLYTK